MEEHLDIMSYNIWFDKIDAVERLESLLTIINICDPHVVCLQEVTQMTYEKIKKYAIDKEYNIYPEKMKNTYGCVILSKNPFVFTKTYKLETNMGRSLETVHFVHKDKYFVVATCHYESEFKKFNSMKISQYKQTKEILDDLVSKHKNVILCADTNITSYDSEHFITFNSTWKDSWIEGGNDQTMTYTYDGYTNQNLINSQEEYKTKNKYRSRLDRIIYKFEDCDLKLEEFNLVKGSDFLLIEPSDHYGVMSSFKMS